jgi:hypothetical protein
MTTTFKNNAYHILGLDTSASEKNILKRSKEIVNHLKVDDTPVYDLDVGFFKDFRTEDAVKDALQRLQASKKRIKEYFFWFQIADGIDEQVLGLFKIKDYLNAIRIWQKVAEGHGTKASFYKKNLAILYCLVLSSENNKEYLKNSLIVWKELVDSDKFWASFSKVYKLHDEQTASEDIVFDFRNHLLEYLSDIYTELYYIHKDSDYVDEFRKYFSTKGEKIEKSILGPAYQIISQAVEGLEKMEVSKDGIFDKEESETIKRLVSKIQLELNKLIDLGLYDDSQTKIMRDRSANAIRSIVLDLHNNLSEFEKSSGLLEIAIKLAGTESLKNKLQGELELIKNSIKDDIENSLAIEIPGKFKNSTVVFKNNFFEYNDKKIFFKDVLSISFDSTRHSTSVYYIPVSTSYSYRWSVISDKENVSLSFSASRDESNQKDIWIKLAGLASNLIQPYIIKRIVDQIFDRNENVTIGNVEFSKLGYSRTKTKLFGKGEKETVYWTDTIYIPKFDSGMVILWKEKEGKGQQFTTIAMSTPNAVILPDFIQACCNRAK